VRANPATRSELAVPLKVDNRVIGVLQAKSPQREAFTGDDERLLATIASQLATAIARLRSAAEREALILDLEAKNAELERFTYTVSHDLKSPLITVRGFLGFVEQDARAGNFDRMEADLARIVEATDKMRRLLDDLLELSRIGRLMNSPEAVAFDAIAQEAIQLVHGRLEARGVQVELAPGLPVVYGDRARLVEVVQNLIDNACKFMGDQPEPQITIGQQGADRDGKPIVFVRDNGVGIHPRYHEKVFGLFNKLDARGEGTGVGLALVKRIVEVHGGRIWVESEEGQGATFLFTLPAGALPIRSGGGIHGESG
jgi:signal transduction histidine kinase